MWRNTQVWLKGPVLKTGRSATARGFESLFLRHKFFVKYSNGFNAAFLVYDMRCARFMNLLEYTLISRDGAVVARWAHNPKVAGSSPAPATIIIFWSRGVAVITSACHAEDREFDSRRDRHFILAS